MNKFENARREAEKAEIKSYILETIYAKVENEMHWDICIQENDEWVEPENVDYNEDSYGADKYYKLTVYKEIMKMIEKML